MTLATCRMMNTYEAVGEQIGLALVHSLVAMTLHSDWTETLYTGYCLAREIKADSLTSNRGLLLWRARAHHQAMPQLAFLI